MSAWSRADPDRLRSSTVAPTSTSSVEDLLKKQLMTRLICHRVGGCMQRCMGTDALNALFSVTYDCDQACGTEYHASVCSKYIEYCQENDLDLQLRPDRREGFP